ncbi:MAG: DUF2269 family protein [Ktedonobacterales bacterium]
MHMSAAIGNFVAVGLLLFGVAALRRARRVKQVRVLADLVGRAGPLFGISILLILVAGLYMTFASWSFQTGWVAVALVSLLLIAPIAGVIVESRRRVIAKLANEAQDGPLPATLLTRIHDPVLVTTPRTVTALLLGIVFLMTNKPSLPVALLVMAIALVLGLASGLLVSGTSRTVDQGMAGDATRVAHE